MVYSHTPTQGQPGVMQMQPQQQMVTNNPMYTNTAYNNSPMYNNQAMGYGQPSNVTVVRNQYPMGYPHALIMLDPLPMFCGRCNTTVLSRVETNCSCANLCCCVCFGPVLWMCFQCCRGKTISCSNAVHYCPTCSTSLGFYEAC
jgi:hypothetical protein